MYSVLSSTAIRAEYYTAWNNGKEFSYLRGLKKQKKNKNIFNSLRQVSAESVCLRKGCVGKFILHSVRVFHACIILCLVGARQFALCFLDTIHVLVQKYSNEYKTFVLGEIVLRFI